MYTAEQDDDHVLEEFLSESPWAILDPDGDRIATVFTKTEADGLLSHLNKP